MYGIRLKARSSHGATTPAASTTQSGDASSDRESGAGLTHSPGYKEVSGSRVDFTEYNNNTLLTGVGNAVDLMSGLGGGPSASLLSGRMLSSSSSSRSNVVARSSYAHSAFLSDTCISQAEYFGRSTMVEEAQTGGVISSKTTVHSKSYTAQRQRHGRAPQQTPEVYVEHVSNGTAVQLEEVQSGVSVRRKRVSFKSKVRQKPAEVSQRNTGINAGVCRSVPVQYEDDSDEDKPEDEDAAEFRRVSHAGLGVGSSRENGHQGGSMRRSFSKSANDLLHRTRSPSGERSSEASPKGSPTLGARKSEEGERARANTQPRPAPSFFTTLRRVKKMAAELRLKTKFHRTLSKESKMVARRKDVLVDGVRSNSHPDVSVERQDSTTDYAADYSSAEQSSSGTPLTMSPRRGPHLAATRFNSNDTKDTESQGNKEVLGEAVASAEASIDPDTSGAQGESGDLGASIASNFSPPTPARVTHIALDTSPSLLLGHGAESDTSQQPMLCEGESVTVAAPSPPQASSSTTNTVCEVWSKEDPAVLRQRALRQHSFFQLHVHLKRGQDLVARDACGKLLPQYSSYQSGETTRAGTSDPYVKFKVGGKLAHKSKTVYKDLNPTWDETFTLAIEDPFEPVTVKVFDYDWGLQDDFMGLATIDLTTLDLDKCTEVALPLAEPRKTPSPYMGVIHMSLTLQPKTQEEKEQVGDAFCFPMSAF
ncbi:uncharacterized protein LOC127005898 isoform X3 [Eriocheir sinensis]|uniref:uncharacterized protein LOC127005898 isoform X3 n=1 Tax=Eriocheir sinensis TaxID=95602 RepID=UPI0021C84E88|nr:uncharacterized protein LOC127005898 isoform X3 [Eriocheir sinensis]